jgi:ubiquitin
MKAKAVLVAVFVAGIAASFAVAAPSDDDGGKGKGKHRGATVAATTAATTGTTTTTPAQTCRNVELKGTAAPSTFTMTVEKASKRARNVKSATVTISGRVKVSARMCSTGGQGAAATFQLRVLKVGKADDEDDD